MPCSDFLLLISSFNCSPPSRHFLPPFYNEDQILQLAPPVPTFQYDWDSGNQSYDGKKCVAKEIVEAIDKENKYIRFKIIEGDLLNEFKSLTVSLQVIRQGEITGVKWIAEFEKIHDDGPYPTKIMDFAIAVTQDIEAHHLKN